MNTPMPFDRRRFFKLSSLAAGAAMMPSWVNAQNAPAAAYSAQLPKLPYEYDALAPHIDAKTMEIHHSKHHAGYAIPCKSLAHRLQEDFRAAEPSVITADGPCQALPPRPGYPGPGSA